ncbi:ROK family protein [Anaeromicropila populeti]|uniref:fructokinase n=1 Tax=Anaeromicropila populeti TaxID=37658 RepID=A0A1I6IQQ6_9FIRM|nr:ROK family protein [Anaeromicropila populeti]SFR69064.1 fructokinase [Anaeromicropila populeti]
MLLGGLEAGGTKMVCAVGDENGKLIDRKVFPTETPDVTIPAMISYFKDFPVEAIGIGSFGPLDLDRKSETFGYITSTPKPFWGNVNLRGAFLEEFHIPVGIDTDVNGAALAEATWGAGAGCDVVLYITIGTGVGVGVCIGGKLLHGLVHPEAGHILLEKLPNDTYSGKCPFHPNCLEGLAAGPAIEGRWGKKAIELADSEGVWKMEAEYVSQALVNYILTYSPNKIVLWGGVMHQPQLFPMIRNGVVNKLNGYIRHDAIVKNIEEYIVAPKLGDDPGIMGALRLGYLEMMNSSKL